MVRGNGKVIRVYKVKGKVNISKRYNIWGVCNSGVAKNFAKFCIQTGNPVGGHGKFSKRCSTWGYHLWKFSYFGFAKMGGKNCAKFLHLSWNLSLGS